MIKLHYAALDNHEDIPCVELPDTDKLRQYFENNIEPDKRERVYLLAQDKEVIVTENIKLIRFNIYFLLPLLEREGDIHLQEYASYEDAYAVALSMKEISPLCYRT